jgi:hypothetical protein
MSKAVQRLGVALAGVLAAIFGSLGLASSASAATDVMHNVDVTGAVFTCSGGITYTAVSGTATFLMHESSDAIGGTHVTGTVAPKNVTLESSAGGTYRLAGASWFGGNFSASSSGPADFTDTEHFVILGPGGVVDNVQIVAHFTQNANGTTIVEFEKNTGTCIPPED